MFVCIPIILLVHDTKRPEIPKIRAIIIYISHVGEAEKYKFFRYKGLYLWFGNLVPAWFFSSLHFCCYVVFVVMLYLLLLFIFRVSCPPCGDRFWAQKRYYCNETSH